MPLQDKPAHIPWSVCETQTQGRSMRKLAEEMGAFAGARSPRAPAGDTKLARRHRRSMLPRSAAAPATAPARLRRRAAVAASSHLRSRLRRPLAASIRRQPPLRAPPVAPHRPPAKLFRRAFRLLDRLHLLLPAGPSGFSNGRSRRHRPPLVRCGGGGGARLHARLCRLRPRSRSSRHLGLSLAWRLSRSSHSKSRHSKRRRSRASHGTHRVARCATERVDRSSAHRAVRRAPVRHLLLPAAVAARRRRSSHSRRRHS